MWKVEACRPWSFFFFELFGVPPPAFGVPAGVLAAEVGVPGALPSLLFFFFLRPFRPFFSHFFATRTRVKSSASLRAAASSRSRFSAAPMAASRSAAMRACSAIHSASSM